jgi:hypothetical protein
MDLEPLVSPSYVRGNRETCDGDAASVGRHSLSDAGGVRRQPSERAGNPTPRHNKRCVLVGAVHLIFTGSGWRCRQSMLC